MHTAVWIHKSRMLTYGALPAAASAWLPATLQLISRQLMSVPSLAEKSCSNPVLWASCCCALRSETCVYHAILPFCQRHSEPDRGRWATTEDALPSLLASLRRTFSTRICVSACEYEPWSRSANTRRDAKARKDATARRDANAIRNGNAKGDGNTRQHCCTKIEFQEALTVKHPKTITAGARILTLFSETSADSRVLDSRTLSLFLKTLADFRFPDLAPCDSPNLWSLNLLNLTMPPSHQTHSARNPAPDTEAELLFHEGRILVPDYLRSRPRYWPISPSWTNSVPTPTCTTIALFL